MSSHLPRQLDPHRLAANGATIRGEIPAEQFKRLRDVVEMRGAPVEVQLECALRPDGLPTISGAVTSRVEMVCQRCLEPMSVDLGTHVNLAVVPTEQDALRLSAELDPVICGAGESVALAELVEDELLLALPIVAFHEDEQECSRNIEYLDAAEPRAGTESERPNPFAVLKNLKKD